jgi:hypothetical protein
VDRSGSGLCVIVGCIVSGVELGVQLSASSAI